MIEQQALPLTVFYEGWTSVQRNLAKMIAPLTAEQLAVPAAPHHWSIGRVAQHIVGNRVWWFQLWMGAGDPSLAPLERWDFDDQPALSAAELVAGLESTWQMVQDALARWTTADIEDAVPLPESLTEEEKEIFSDSTRQWIIWHVLEHEILHAGEISLGLGTSGLKTFYD